jgi:endonuclease/exonuclease/phosphatase family metal-dependent hydrolase
MKEKKWFKRLSKFFKFLTIFAMLGLLLSYFSPFVHPKTVWFLPFFGLLYPVFIIINLCLLVLFALFRSKWSFVLLFIILIGGKLHFRQFALSGPEKNEPDKTAFTVMSYNVRLFDLYNWSVDSSNKNRHSIFNFLDEKQPDIVCFQEFYHQDKSLTFPTRDSLIDILHTVDYHERYSYKIKGRRNFGIAILSKFPLIAKGEVPLQLASGNSNDNYCIFVDVVHFKDTFRVYNVHLQSIKIQSDEFTYIDPEGRVAIDKSAAIENVVTKLRKAYPMRADQAELVINHAKESPFPVIICGDFNDTPLSYTYQEFQKEYKDAFRELSSGIGPTYAGKIPAGRIDYIFYGKGLKGWKFDLQDRTWSDHRAIWCRFSKDWEI